MTESITDISREFFFEVVLPLLEREMPEVAARTAFGLFGYGSEAYGRDDEYSRDHHWGLRIDALMPDALFAARCGYTPQISPRSSMDGSSYRRIVASQFGIPDLIVSCRSRTSSSSTMPICTMNV